LGSNVAAQYIASLVPATILRTVAVSPGVHAIDVLMPPGHGPMGRNVFVNINGLLTQAANYTYSAPVITNVAPARTNLTGVNGQLLVYIDGSSFCSGTDGCGTLLIDFGTGFFVAASPRPSTWSDNEVAFFCTQPAVGDTYRVQIVVDGYGSNIVSFAAPVPSWDALIGQGTWLGMSTLGGEPFYINGVSDIGALDTAAISILVGTFTCTNLTKTLQVRETGLRHLRTPFMHASPPPPIHPLYSSLICSSYSMRLCRLVPMVLLRPPTFSLP
jgi:hypothetical protein